MPGGFACIHSEAASYIGYVVQLEVSSVAHARNILVQRPKLENGSIFVATLHNMVN